MEMGIVAQNFDIAQITLYLFWAFFAGLIYYLHRENKREGYPLETDRPQGGVVQGFPAVPAPKTYLMRDGSLVYAPKPEQPRSLRAQHVQDYPGTPIEPTGDPMQDGVGPAAYALRAEHPELSSDDRPTIVPMRLASDHWVAEEDPDPRGMAVVGVDNVVGGTVADIWIDRSEVMIRYLEIAVATTGAHVLLPMTMARVSRSGNRVTVDSIRGDQFAGVPPLANPTQVTLREEDRICAYYAGGHLYALPSRSEPLI
jgi:photosynthetic reaction center H subunit